MSDSTERSSGRRRGRRLAVAGVASAVLLGGGAGVAYASSQGSTGPTSEYGTVVDEQGAPVRTWPGQTAGRSDSTGTRSGTPGGDDQSPRGSENCPDQDGGPGAGDGDSGSGSTPTEPTIPSTPEGDQL